MIQTHQVRKLYNGEIQMVIMVADIVGKAIDDILNAKQLPEQLWAVKQVSMCV